jgi:hypothetical protein
MRILYLLLAALLFITSCEKELPLPKNSFPLVTTSVIDIDETGVTFVGALAHRGNSELTEYGFYYSLNSWAEIDGISYSPEMQTIKVTNPDENQFSVRIETGLASNVSYTVRAYVRAGQIHSQGNKVVFLSKGSFEPVIDSFTPSKIMPYQEIEIFGNFFAPSANINQVMFGEISGKVKEASVNRLLVEVPYFVQNLKTPITVRTLHRSGKSIDSIEIINPWKKTINLVIANDPGTGFLRNNKYYIPLRWSRNIVEYDPLTNIYTTLNISLGLHYTWVCSNDEKAYLLTGNYLLLFDPHTSNLTPFDNYPATINSTVFMFLLNNDVYIGSIDGNIFKKLDVQSGLWTNKTSLNKQGEVFSTSYFSLNDKGYLMLKNNGLHFYEYNPITDNWTEIAFLDNDMQSPYWFLFGNTIYTADGRKASLPMKKFANGIWEDIPQLPLTVTAISTFVYEGKGYCVCKSNSGQNQIWEFDPVIMRALK